MQFSQSKLPPTKESHFLFIKEVPCVKRVLGHLSRLLAFLTYTGYYKGMSGCLATLHVPPRILDWPLSSYHHSSHQTLKTETEKAAEGLLAQGVE